MGLEIDSVPPGGGWESNMKRESGEVLPLMVPMWIYYMTTLELNLILR